MATIQEAMEKAGLKKEDERRRRQAEIRRRSDDITERVEDAVRICTERKPKGELN